MTDRRTATVTARVSAAELADWRAKAKAAGVPLSALIRRAMARTRMWTAPAADIERERTRQIARIGSGLSGA
ncbi:plasmid mobilization protein [Candidatus Palauibacter sp.]|uniref:plasmid mobilization protein n=1 Tax=Candidatus Palauibacter sp. TaxID=3101350 RepID=UPI003B5250BE